MEFLYFAAVGLFLYFVSDWLLRRIEGWHGGVSEYRTPIFFAIFLTLILLAFALIRHVSGT